MIVVLGIVVGFILGAVVLDWSGGLAGALVGFIVMMAWRSRTQAAARQTARPMPPLAAGALAASPPSLEARLVVIEARLAALEERLAARGQSATAPAAAAVSSSAADGPGFARTRDGTLEPVPVAVPAPDGRRATAELVVPPKPRAVAAAPTPNPIWAWFTGGNALTRIGVIALFLGIGFLLKYLADYVTVPIGVRLAGVAAAGVILVVLGARLMRMRPGYGVSLQGAGVGVLYLTTFAALRLYGVLESGPAFALLFAISGITVALAVRADSQPLAGLAVAGGFVAPFLVATASESPAMLLGYFLVLNVAILALALRKSWRALNAVGFVFTFVLGGVWGYRFYQPAQFATVEPFLVALYLLYVAVAILHARRAPLAAKQPVDGLLVFGVPLVAFALQAGLVRDTRYGVALSAFAVAAFYAVLAGVLRHRAAPGFALLTRAFAALAVVFLTIAIPFAADPRWTPAWWALEAAAVYWIGCVQRQPLARGFALLLQVGAAFAFGIAGPTGSGTIFANAAFLGGIVVALAAFATVRLIDRHADSVSATERSLAPFVLVWGIGGWLVTGAFEIARVLPARSEAPAMLAYVVTSIVVAIALVRILRWPRLAWSGAALLPVLLVAAVGDWQRAHTTLAGYGLWLWPLAWVVQWATLAVLERSWYARDESPAPAGTPWLGRLHATSAAMLVAWLAWEASEWAGRIAPAGSVWMPCAAVWPAMLYLAAMARLPVAAPWPFATFREAYARHAATVVATLAGVWFLLVNLLSPGGAPPLPYVPLANPLDLTLLAVACALFAWAARAGVGTARHRYAWLGLALFVLVNAIVLRTVHQWLGVPWRLAALVGSKPLQAALTLTWTATALPLMVLAHRRALRPLWMAGAALLAIVVVKLFVLDLAALSGLPRIVAFIGVGVLLLVIGYLAPLPPAPGSEGRPREGGRPPTRSGAGADPELAQDRLQEAPAGEPALQQVRTDEGGEREPPRAHE